jgi:pyruvate/2-oxoglutarate/acetoin dehydrogenase E1 component
VRKTGHLVVVDQGSTTCGFAAEIVTAAIENVFDALNAAPVRIALPDIPTPTTRALSNFYYPTPRHVANAARRMLGRPTEDPWSGIAPEDKTLDVPDQSFTGPF